MNEKVSHAMFIIHMQINFHTFMCSLLAFLGASDTSLHTFVGFTRAYVKLG